MFGVMGNIALASILFCVQHVIKPEDWCPILVRTVFRSLIDGIAPTMVLSMLPTGFFQFYQSFHYDLWYGRSGQFVEDPLLRNLAKMWRDHCGAFLCVCVCVRVWSVGDGTGWAAL